MQEVEKGVLGHDPKVHMMSEMQIRSQDHLNLNYRKLDLPPPIIGKHRHQSTTLSINWNGPQPKPMMMITKCLVPHGSSSSSCSTPASTVAAKATMCQAKLPEPEQIKEPRGETAKRHKTEKKPNHRDATRAATLIEELSLFKEITRAIIKHDAKQEDAKLIQMEKGNISDASPA